MVISNKKASNKFTKKSHRGKIENLTEEMGHMNIKGGLMSELFQFQRILELAQFRDLDISSLNIIFVKKVM